MESLTADQVLDCWGLVCPMPVRKTAQALGQLAAGKVLQVIATDDWFEPDLQAWLRDQPHELLRFERQRSEFHAYLRKRELLSDRPARPGLDSRRAGELVEG